MVGGVAVYVTAVRDGRHVRRGSPGLEIGDEERYQYSLIRVRRHHNWRLRLWRPTKLRHPYISLYSTIVMIELTQYEVHTTQANHACTLMQATANRLYADVVGNLFYDGAYIAQPIIVCTHPSAVLSDFLYTDKLVEYVRERLVTVRRLVLEKKTIHVW